MLKQSIARNISRPIHRPVLLTEMRNAGGTPIAFYNSVPQINGTLLASLPQRGTRRSLILPSQQPGRDYDFDGLDDYIALAHNAAFDVTTLSASAWVYPTDATTFRTIYAKRNSARGHRLELFTAIPRAIVQGDTQITLASPSTLPLNAWSHVAYTVGASTSTLYVNGVAVHSLATPAGSINNTEPIHLGRLETSGSIYYLGKMWDFRLWNSALTADQIRELYVNGITALSTLSPLLWYKCEDQHPTLALDSSGNGRHGTKTAIDATVGQFHYEGSDLPRQTGENEQGFSLREEASYGDIHDSVFAGANAQFAIEATFVVAPDDGTPYTICGKLADTLAGEGQRQWVLRQVSGGIQFLYFTQLTPASNFRGIGVLDQSVFVPGEVCTVRVEYDGTVASGNDRVRFFVNGVEAVSDVKIANGTISSTSTAIPNGTAPLSVSCAANTAQTTAYYPGLGYTSRVRIEDSNVGGTAVFEVQDSSGFADLIGYAPKVSYATLRIPAATASTDALGGTLTYTGKSPIDAKLKQSWCGNFNGTTGHITFASIDDGRFDFQRDDSLDIEFYLKTTDPAGDVMSKLKNAVPLNGWAFNLFGGKLSFILSENFTAPRRIQVDTPININDGVMRHFRWTYDGSGSASGVKLYLDGVLTTLTVTQDTLSLPLPSYSGLTFAIGARVSSDFFAGQVFGIKITKNGSLLFHAPLAEGEGSPVTFDVVSGAAGTIVADDTTVGGTFWGRQDEYHYNAAEGCDRLPRFNGTNQYLTCGFPLQGATEFTIWRRELYLSNSAYDIDGFLVSSADAVRIGRNTGGTPMFVSAGWNFPTFPVGGTIPDNQWATSALTAKMGGNYFVYVNNAQTATGSVSGSWNDPLDHAGREFGIGASIENTVTHHSNKIVSEYRIYTRQLSASELTYLETRGASGTDPGTADLVRYYNFGKSLRDLSPANTGVPTAHNMTFDDLQAVIVPAGSNGSSLVSMGSVGRPPALHNGAESGIDWTGGVAFPQPALPVNILKDGPADFTKWPTVATSWSATSQEVQGLPVYNLISTAATTPQYAAWNTLNITSGQKYSFSVLLKDAGARYAQIGSAVFGGLVRVNIDLETGTIGSNDFFTEYASLTDVGNGWYLFEGVDTATNTGSNGTITLGFASGPTSGRITNFTGDGSAGILCAGFMVESGVKRRQVYNPTGIINGLDTDWYAFDTPANPHFQRHISDGFGNILKIDRRLHYANVLLGSELTKVRNYTADPQGLLADNFNRADQTTLGLDWYPRLSPGNIQISGDDAAATLVAGGENLFLRPLKTATQRVEFLIDTTVSTNAHFGFLLRCDEEALNGVMVLFRASSTSNVHCYNLSNGSYLNTQIASISPTPANGQLVAVEIEGTDVRMYQDGTLKHTFDISAYPDRTANRFVGIRPDGVAGMKLDNFKARDI